MKNKLLLAIVLILLLLLILSCNSPLAKSDYIGVWYAQSDYKETKTITINKDGIIKYNDFTSNNIKKVSKNKFEAKFNIGSKKVIFNFDFTSTTEGKVTIKDQKGNTIETMEIVKKYILVPSYFIDTNNLFI